MHTGSRTIQSLRDSPRECRDLGLEVGTGRRQSFQNGDKHGQLTGVNRRLVFRVMIALERAEPNPSLTRWRSERATNGISDATAPDWSR